MTKKIPLPLFAILICSCSSGITNWNHVDSQSLPGIVGFTFYQDGMVGYSTKCTGVLVKSDTVLTAAHCVDNTPLSYMNVVYDCNDLYDVFGCDKASLISLTSLEIYDLSLVKIDKDLTNENIKTVEILNESPNIGQRVIIGGFGTGGRLRYSYSNIYETSQYSFITNFSNKTPPEKGDSGGPAYVIKNNNFMLIGITSELVKRYEIKEDSYRYFFKGIRHSTVYNHFNFNGD